MWSLGPSVEEEWSETVRLSKAVLRIDDEVSGPSLPGEEHGVWG